MSTKWFAALALLPLPLMAAATAALTAPTTQDALSRVLFIVTGIAAAALIVVMIIVISGRRKK